MATGVLRTELLHMSQDRDEPFRSFAARVRGKAETCTYSTTCTCIPQGSVMGPLLFNIVINDLKSATSKFDVVMYADDTTLVSTLENFGDRNNAKEIEQNINKEIYKITTWRHSNKLRLNSHILHQLLRN